MKVLHVINAINVGGAEKLLIESLPIYNKILKTDLLLLKKTNSPFYKILKKNNINNVFYTGLKSIYNPLQIFKIRKYMEEYDVINVHLFPSLYWVALAKILFKPNVKIIFTEHSTSNKRMRNKYLKLIDRFIYKQYDNIVCITDDVYKAIQDHTLLPSDSLSVINNGVNLDSIYKSEPYNFKQFSFFLPENQYLIQVSSFQYPKDQKTLIESLKSLSSNVQLILVGDGVKKEELENYVQNENLNGRVHFLGLRTDVYNLLKGASIVVLSSKYEGFGLAIVEGMAANKPVIASDVSGLREIVKGHGVLFEFGNPKDLADKITSLLTDRDYYITISEKCKKRAVNFDIHRMVDSYVNLYKEII